MNFDSSFVTCSCSNGNENDYETLLKMMLKFRIITVTFHKGNVKIIRSFGENCTIDYVFEGNELVEIETREMSFTEWITSEFLLHKGDGSTITIYNR